MCLNLVVHFILVYLLFVSAEEDVEEARKLQSGFLFTIPKALQAGKNETVCISTHFMMPPPSSNSAKIIIDLKIKERHYITTKFLYAEHSCFDLNLTNLDLKEPKFVSVKVQILINGKMYSAHNADPILIYPFKRITFIETDRKIYKPGELIKIRLLVLHPNMLPSKNYKIKLVKIKNPFDITVAVWENVTTELGLAQLEQQLPKESIEGTWRVESDGEVKYFDVKRYILPRFHVEIDYPKVIYYEWETINIKVCAKYKHGFGVKGNAFIKLKESQQLFPPIESSKKIKECTNFSFTAIDLQLQQLKTRYSQLMDTNLTIEIFTSITEYGTDQTEIKTGTSRIIFKPFHMKFISDNIFIPGIPYMGLLQLSEINIPMQKQIIQICYNLAIRKSWNFFNNQECLNFTVLQEQNEISFQIPPLKNNIIHLHIQAHSLNYTNIGANILIVRLYSSNSNYLQIEKNEDVTDCRTMQHFNILYTTDHLRQGSNITFFYMIKSRGQFNKLKKIVHTVQKAPINISSTIQIGTKHRHSRSNLNLDRFPIKFKIDERILSNYQLLVYYITDQGETVTGTLKMWVNPCLNNKVVAKWATKQGHPGSSVALLIGTTSDSLCSISSVDKATKIFNNIQILDMNNFLAHFTKEFEFAPTSRKTCITPGKKDREFAAMTNLTDDGIELDEKMRKKRHVYSFSEDFDAFDIFNRFGITTITNFKIITKPCYAGPALTTLDQGVQFLKTDQYHDQIDEKIVPIRSFFPETWLWELVPVRGAEIIHRDLPHTITDWITNVMCISDNQGVGFSPPTQISAFQPFFIDIVMPYSIKKGEILYLHVVSYNYQNHNLPVRITLGDSIGLELVDLMNRRTVSYCVFANDSSTHVFELKAMEIGIKNITVLAEVDAAYPGECGPEILINKRDVMIKSLIVEPEGYQMKVSKSAFLCGTDAQVPNSLTWNVQIPNDHVPRTADMKITINGDLLIQTAENLEQLLTMPTGCGEQIMSSMAPNLFILRYLKATNSLTHSLKQRILRNLKIGYQRILNYALSDGSFSAFGYYDPYGSMFLTTFVVRVLQQARAHIYVDQKIIDRAVAWIYEHQLENGCFSTMSHVFQDMGESNTENSTAALTSYVIISLIDANISLPERIKTNAKYCIRGHYHLDKYTLAISAYALFRINWYTEAQRMINKLEQISNQQDGKLWWNSKEINNSSATDVEITSYVLLSMLFHKTQENLAKAHSILRWLLTKIGPNGGFKSTQDTVVALDALTKYAIFVNNQKLNLNISISTIQINQMNYQYLIRNQDRLKSKKLIIKRPEESPLINVDVKGDGCILVQLLASYYLRQIPYSNTFKLDTEISSVSNIDECSIAKLSFCFGHQQNIEMQTNMAILEVELPSGYQADRATLYNLQNNPESRLKMFEEIDGKVILYFTKVDQKHICINFNINERAIVQSRSKSAIKLYDYYKPEYEVLQFYKLKEVCKIENATILGITTEFFPVLTDSDYFDSNEKEMKNLAKRHLIN